MYIWGDFVVGAVFWILSALILFSGLMVVIVKNIIHAALWLIASFAGVAALYFLLEAPFIGVVQILVYTGAVSILVLFAIMLTRQVMGERARQLFSRWWVAAIVAILLFGGVMVPAIWNPELPASAQAPADGEAAAGTTYWPQSDRAVTEAQQGAEAQAGDDAAQEDPATTFAIAGPYEIGLSLVQEYVVPFEVAAILLLVALLGAVTIAYEERTRRRRILTLAEEAELRRSISGLGLERPMQATADTGDMPEAGTAERG